MLRFVEANVINEQLKNKVGTTGVEISLTIRVMEKQYGSNGNHIPNHTYLKFGYSR
jgi:hypothetical protein